MTVISAVENVTHDDEVAARRLTTGVLDECDTVDAAISGLCRRCCDRRDGCPRNGVRQQRRVPVNVYDDHDDIAAASNVDTKPTRPNRRQQLHPHATSGSAKPSPRPLASRRAAGAIRPDASLAVRGRRGRCIAVKSDTPVRGRAV
jgi:hypothetical protein